jgi:hypothetical protein
MLIAVLLQIGLSQKRLLDAFHPDALYLFQMTTDLQYVCTKLADPNVREPRMVRHKAGGFGCVCVWGGGSLHAMRLFTREERSEPHSRTLRMHKTG